VAARTVLKHYKEAGLRERRLMVYGKGGPFGTKSKRRVIPLTARQATYDKIKDLVTLVSGKVLYEKSQVLSQE
jgi:hypothetical protein